MKRFLMVAAVAVAFLGLSHTASAQFSLQALSSFGGDGWLAPGELGFNDQTNATVRGIAYDAGRNQVYVVDRNGGTQVEIRDGNTGALTGTLDTSIVAGGTFNANMIGVADDGAIYMGNLSTTNASGITDNFKVYRWSDPSAIPTVAFDGQPGRTRTGDSFAVTGSGANTRIVAAGGSGAGEGFLALTGDTSMSGSNQNITGVANGAFRLSIDFADANTVIGAQTGAILNQGPFAGGAGSTSALIASGESIIGFEAQNALLATVDFPTSTVRLYDASNLGSLTLLDTANLTGSFVSNGNAVGAVSFGVGPDGGLRLYALNANNGIQAFSVVPEPSAALLSLLGLTAAFIRRRRS